MGDSTADGTGESEARVEIETLGVGRVGSSSRGLDGVKLGGAGGRGGGLGRHCDDGGEMEKKRRSGECGVDGGLTTALAVGSR